MRRTVLLRVVVRVAAVVALGTLGAALAGGVLVQPDDIVWLRGPAHVTTAVH